MYEFVFFNKETTVTLSSSLSKFLYFSFFLDILWGKFGVSFRKMDLISGILMGMILLGYLTSVVEGVGDEFISVRESLIS